MTNKIHYATWARSTSELSILLESATRVGIKIDLMICKGFLDKIKSLNEHLNSLDDQDYIICTDGYDVIYTRSADDILTFLKKEKDKVLFGGEKNCYHHFPDVKEYFEKEYQGEPYPYLNSGLIAGQVKHLKNVLKEIMGSAGVLRQEFSEAKGKVGFFNDQTIYGKYAKENTNKICVDSKSEYFWTLTDEKYDLGKYVEVGENGIKNLFTGTFPAAVHVSHTGKFYLPYLNIAWNLGLTLDDKSMNQKLANKLWEKSQSNKPDHIKLESGFENYLKEKLGMNNPSLNPTRSIAIIFIGTGKYVSFFKNFYATNVKLFLPNSHKKYYVFTDNFEQSGVPLHDDIVVIDIEALQWPYSTLYRYKNINNIKKRLSVHSHVIYIDADMYVHAEINEKEFFDHNKPLFGVQHPGNYLNGIKPFAKNADSLAYVSNSEDYNLYYQGCFWGGTIKEILSLVDTLSKRIEIDLEKNIIARWHDESHLNKYFIEKSHLVHKLSCGYAFPESLEEKLKVDKKVIHISKKHKEIRKSVNKKPKSNVPHADISHYKELSKEDVLIKSDKVKIEYKVTGIELLDLSGALITKIHETDAQVLQLCEGRFNIGDLIEVFCSISTSSKEEIKMELHLILGYMLKNNWLSFSTKRSDNLVPAKPQKKLTESITKNVNELVKCDKSGIQFFSFSNNINNDNLSILKESAMAHGIHVMILGNGLKKFSTTIKLDLLYKELCKLGDREIVCALDGFDVFFSGSGEEIKRRFQNSKCDILISAERAYSHQFPKYRQFYDQLKIDSPYRYINAGSIIGYAGALRKMYKSSLSLKLQQRMYTAPNINRIKRSSEKLAKAMGYEKFDKGFIYSHIYYTDQQHIGKYIAKNPDRLKIKIDHDTLLFWCTAFEWKDIKKHYKIENSRIINVNTNNDPLLIHVPGWRAYKKVLLELFERQKELF